jgi:hypothetical protein
MTMKIGSCLSFTPLGAVLALACMILSGGAAAKASNYNFELTQVSSQCTGPALFKVRMSFKPAPDAKGEYEVGSGNACQLAGTVPPVTCGTGGGCKVKCNGPGPCGFDLVQCQQGKGKAVVKISVPYVYNPNTTAIQAPGPCR